MSAFLQITDTHIVPKGELAVRHSDTATALQTAIATINAQLAALGPLDCAILTGDLTDHGTPEEYAHFAQMMAELRLPWRAVPGNHDRREAMRAAFANESWMPEDGPIHWVHDLGAYAIIGLDTLLEDAHHGWLSDAGFAFLDATLEALGARPIVVATHHPWMHTGIPSMDADNLRNGAALMARLEAYPGPVRMISGHVHRTLTTQIGKVTCQIAPAPGHAVLYDTRPEVANSLILEPGGVTLYRWLDQPSPALISNVVPVGTFAGPWPFAADAEAAS